MNRGLQLAAALLPLLLVACGDSGTPESGQEIEAPPPAVDPLDQLNDPDPAIRSQAIRSLAALRDAGTTSARVFEYLRTPQPRKSLAPLLDAWGDTALQTFVEGERDPGERAATLAAMESPGAIGPLIELLGVEDAAARGLAGDALLGRMNQARPKLESVLRDSSRFNPDVRFGAALLLCRGQPDATPDPCLGPLLGSGLDSIRDPGPVALLTGAQDYLVARSRDADPRVRGDALVLLSAFGAAALDPLLAALEEENPILRTAAAAALSHVRDPRTVEPLLAELGRSAEEEWAQIEAANLEEDMEDEEGEEAELDDASPDLDLSRHDALVEALQNALRVQGAAAVKPLLKAEAAGLVPLHETDAVLRNMKPAELVPPLINLLADPGDVELRRVADLLANSGDAAAVVPLLDALADPAVKDTYFLGNAVLRFLEAAVEPCLSRLHSEAAPVRAACVGLLAVVDPVRYAEALRVALADPDPQVIIAAAGAAHHLKDDASVRARLLQLLTHTDQLVRISAAQALGQMRDAAAVPALIAAIGKLEFSPYAYSEEEEAAVEQPLEPEPDERLTPRPSNVAVEALSAIGVPAVAPILDALERGVPAPVASVLLYALADIPKAVEDPRTGPILAAAIDATDRSQQAAGVWAIAALRPPQWLQTLLRAFERERRKQSLLVADYVMALGHSSDAAAAEALIGAMRGDRSDPDRELIIESLGKNRSEPARTWLDTAMAADDLGAVAAAQEYFIRAGTPGTEHKLVAALEEWGDQDMAVNMLNSGNEKLKTAAEQWAEENGYTIIVLPDAGNLPRWGSL